MNNRPSSNIEIQARLSIIFIHAGMNITVYNIMKPKGN